MSLSNYSTYKTKRWVKFKNKAFLNRMGMNRNNTLSPIQDVSSTHLTSHNRLTSHKYHCNSNKMYDSECKSYDEYNGDRRRSKERVSSLITAINKYNKFTGTTFTPGVYLDLGCGNASIYDTISKLLKPRMTICTDIIPSDHPDFSLLVNNRIPIDDNLVDLITCYVAIHHFTSLDNMMLDISRVAKPGCLLFIREHDIDKRVTRTRTGTGSRIGTVGIRTETVVGKGARNRGSNKKDAMSAYLDMIHLISFARRNVQITSSEYLEYSSKYLSKTDLESVMSNYGFHPVTNVLYDTYNPQQLYHTLFIYNPSDITNIKMSKYKPKWSIENRNIHKWINHESFSEYSGSLYKMVKRKLNINYNIFDRILYDCQSDVELYMSLSLEHCKMKSQM